MGKFPRVNDQWMYCDRGGVVVVRRAAADGVPFQWRRPHPAAVPADNIAQLGKALVDPDLVCPAVVNGRIPLLWLERHVNRLPIYVAREKKVDK